VTEVKKRLQKKWRREKERERGLRVERERS
jgi:hypothetical protein